MNAIQLIAEWRDGRISYGKQVRITNLILATNDECWLPPNRPPEIDCPERENSVQVIGNIEVLFENIPPMAGGGILYWFDGAVVEGKVCQSTIAGYPVAITDISHLSAMDDFGIQYVSGLGKEGPKPRAIKFDYDALTGKVQATEIECVDE